MTAKIHNYHNERRPHNEAPHAAHLTGRYIRTNTQHSVAMSQYYCYCYTVLLLLIYSTFKFTS